jgi:GAF domain-containing protein
METSEHDATDPRAGVSAPRSDSHSMATPSRDAATRLVVREVEALLRMGGARAALAWLNGRVRFRFTGLYHAAPPLLRNVHLVDRENPTLNVSGEVCPLDETYCAITCAREASFSTTDARLDSRLLEHPARNAVISYAGVPLRLAGGRAWGTLCHFDLRPRLLPATELKVLDAVAPAFVHWLEETRLIS